MNTSPPVPASSSAANRFVQRIAELMDASEKTQRQIALELGYENANIMTMFKQGTTRLPFDKVPVFAFSLEVDEVELVRLWLQIYEPQMLTVIDRTTTLLTPNERGWLNGVRQEFGDDVPAFDDDARRLVELLARLRSTK